MEDNQTVTQEHIVAVDRLQSLCAEIYLRVVPYLRTGQTEADIAEIIRSEFNHHGIDSFWYNVPIFTLIGPQRFRDMATSNYPLKSPSPTVLLKPGDPVFIDMHPMDAHGYWGDFSAMTVFQARQGIDDEQVTFLRLMQTIQREGIAIIQAGMTARDLSQWYERRTHQEGISLEDPRNTVGHSMHHGTKKYPDGRDKRLFLDKDTDIPLAGALWAIEPGGFKTASSGRTLVGRWEDCVYVSPEGKATIVGHQKPLLIQCTDTF